MSLVQFAGPEFQEEAQQAAVLSSALFAAGRSTMAKINAAGLISISHTSDRTDPSNESDLARYDLPEPRSGGVQPFLILNPEEFDLPAGAIEPLLNRSDVISEIEKLLGFLPRWIENVLVRALPAPVPQVNIGSAIVQARRGTAGFAVSWSGGDGYLTAGHVATKHGGVVLLANRATSPIGNVVFSVDPAGQGAQPLPDVAVVADIPTTFSQNPSSSMHWPAFGDRVDILSSVGTLSDIICAYTDGYYSTPANCCFSNVYLTELGVTNNGDSGAAAVLTGNKAAIGSVVAGTHGYVSLLQKIDYQLHQTRLPRIALN